MQLLISALILLTSFLFLAQTRISSMINTFAWQSALLSLAIILEAHGAGGTKFYLSFATTFLLKVLFIPHLMRYFVKKLHIHHHVADIKYPFSLMIGAVFLVLFCYHLMIPIRGLALFEVNNITAIALAVTLLGMLLLVTHRKAISHIIGFMAMENGIFLLALVSVRGMPMVVELGIAFDVLVAAILFGVFFLHIRNGIDSLDVDRLNLLREDIE